MKKDIATRNLILTLETIEKGLPRRNVKRLAKRSSLRLNGERLDP